MAESTSFAGRFVWRELRSTDLEASRRFYEALLGWDIAELEMGPMGTYTLFKRAGLDVGGAMRAEAGRPAAWLTYITTDDVDRTCAEAVRQGGSVVVPAGDIPGVGRSAVVRDPQGGVFSAFRGLDPGSTDTDAPPAEGSWCRVELRSPDVGASARFYAPLFGWEVAPGERGEVTFTREGRPVAGCVRVDADADVGWLGYVAVSSVDASLERAFALGGTLQASPATLPGAGRSCVLADPAGARFALTHLFPSKE